MVYAPLHLAAAADPARLTGIVLCDRFDQHAASAAAPLSPYLRST
jgi:hypothetical protein